MRLPSRRPANGADPAILRHLQAASGRRSLVLHLLIVLVLVATAQGYDGSAHSTHHWIGLCVYALVSLGLGLADWRASQRGGGTERTTEWLAWTATLLNAGVALFLLVEHMLLGAVTTEETATAVSRLPAFLLLLQTGLSMRVWHTVAFTALVGLGWGGTILLAYLDHDSALLGPYVTLDEEVPGLLTFLAASLVVIDGVRRLRAAVTAALRIEWERTHLARFVPDRVAGELAEAGGIGTVQARHACLLGLDLRGFSAFSRDHAQEEVVRALLDMRALTHVAVTERGGIVDKYIGDGILAQFVVGRPQAQAQAALACARTIRDRLDALNAERRGEGRPPLRITLALHAGEVLVGVFDDGHRAEFTVLGTPMNRLARIEACAKAADLTLVASDHVIRLLSPGVRAGLRLSALPPSECGDIRDLPLFAVAWSDDPEMPDHRAEPALAAPPEPPFLMP